MWWQRSKAVLLPLLVFGLSTPALAQTQHWNMQARERSQNLNSRALNFLLQERAARNKKGGLDEAIALLNKATEEDPTDPQPFATLGLALDMKGEYQQALDNLARSHKLSPNVTETILSIAITQYLGRDYPKSVTAIQTLLKQHPESVQAQACMGFAYLRMGDFENGGATFRNIVTALPNSQVGNQGLALANFFKGDFDLASQALKHAQVVKPYWPLVTLQVEVDALQGNKAILKNLADSYFKLVGAPNREERTMTAIGYPSQHDFHWDPFLADEFDNPSLVIARWLDPAEETKRKALCQRGRAAENLNAVNDALSRSPNDFYLLRQSGLLQMAQGNYAEAAQQLSRALEVSPNDHADMLNLARCFAQSGRAAEASLLVRKFAEMHPQTKLAAIFIELAKVEPPAPPPPPQQAPPPPPPASGF